MQKTCTCLFLFFAKKSLCSKRIVLFLHYNLLIDKCLCFQRASRLYRSWWTEKIPNRIAQQLQDRMSQKRECSNRLLKIHFNQPQRRKIMRGQTVPIKDYRIWIKFWKVQRIGFYFFGRSQRPKKGEDICFPADNVFS